MNESFENWVKRPIANQTIQVENQVSQKAQEYKNKAQQKISTHWDKAKDTAYKPVDYYWKKEAFYRGLFWLAIMALIVLWIISGS